MLDANVRTSLDTAPGGESICLIVEWQGAGFPPLDPCLGRQARMDIYRRAAETVKAPLLAALAERGITPSALLPGMMCAALVGTAEQWRASLDLIQGEDITVRGNAIVHQAA